jgi:1-acyl-sn-glycerol-3-phosphate acyltransferase
MNVDRHAIVYWGIGKTVLAGAVHAAASLKAYGKERVPREGGVVLAVNHLHWIDVPSLGALCPRRIVFVAKAEVLAVPLAGRFVRAMGTLSVRRGESDREAIRLSREAVRANNVLGVFVEGTRQLTGRPGEAKPGAAMIAMQEGVPVLPTAIYGSDSWRPGRRSPVSIAWGEPMRFEHLPRSSKGYKEATAEIEAEILRLWEWLGEMHRLGRPDGTPPRRASLPSRAG